MSIGRCKLVFWEPSQVPGVEKGTSWGWMVQSSSSFYWEESTVNIWHADLSLDDCTEDIVLAKSQVKSCCDHYEALGRPYMKVEQTGVYLSEKQTEIAPQNSAVPSSRPYISVCSHSLRETSLMPSGTQPTSKVSDCLVMVCGKDLEERKREGGTRHVCAKRNCNLETAAAISKKFQFKLHCPSRGSLAVKRSCTSNFPSGVRILL